MEIAASSDNWIQAKNSSLLIVLAFFFLLVLNPLSMNAQDTTFPSGSFIVNMGVVPQNIGNGLKPFGMIYDLIKNYHVPIAWVISPHKVKDGVDFSYNGIDYKGGPFIISQVYITSAVTSRISYWQSQGVIGVFTTSPIQVPVAKTLVFEAIPRWTMDLQNGFLAVPYFTNAGIPASAYSLTKTPAQLGPCDDIFVLPHADPTWATHLNLLAWNLTYHGSIWTSCHAGSTLSNMFNPSNKDQQANFLSEKSGVATGTGPYCENSLILYSNHSNGTPPYSYSSTEFDDPFMQFMGTIDAATQNGSEQVYIPVPASAGWRTSTTVAIYDNIGHPSGDVAHRAVIVAYGRGFGDSNRGYVMFEAGHSHAKAALPDNIAAQRIFFNFSFMAGKSSNIVPDLTGIPTSIISGAPTQVSFTLPSGNVNDYTVTWSASCGGTFVNNPSDRTKATFTPPVVTTATNCAITVSLKDACDRIFNATQASVITCDMQIVSTLTRACYGSSNGSISLAITGVAGPYNWSWAKSGGGGSGSGSSSTSPVVITGLAAGDYTVTITAGSSKVLSLTILANPQINSLAITPVNVRCNGESSGSITLSNPTGGVAPFTYLWNDAVTTQSRTGLSAGTNSVTAKDANNCTATATTTLTQPGAIVITPAVTNLLCNGNPTGAISLSSTPVSGGTSPYSYAWGDGPTSTNRSNLAAGTYNVTVTDNKGCTGTASSTVSQGSAITVSASAGAILSYGGTTTLTVTAGGGTGTLQYSLNGGTYQLGNTFTVLASPSAYVITVKDANNCTATTSLLVTQAAPLSVSTTITNVSCFGGTANGKIDMAITGGSGPFVYSWSRSGGGSGSGSNPNSPVSITALSAGEYTVTVTASNGAGSTSTSTATVSENPQLIVTPTATNLVCNGVSTGSISLAVSGGTPTYTYDWGSGVTTQNRTGLAANTYNVTVTDSKGCTATASSTLTQPSVISITPSTTNVSCNGTATGSVSLGVTGGNGSYTYSWADGPATQNRSSLTAGTYNVTVTDNKGCTATSTSSITQPGALTLNATQINVNCYGGSTGSIDLTPSGGTSPYDYDWGSGITTQDRSSLPAGTYKVTVTDHNGCKAELQKTISQSSAITLSTSLTHETCPSGAGSANGAINLSRSGGTGGYSYSWTTTNGVIPLGQSSNQNLTGLVSGTYTVVVTDTGVPGGGCTATTSATIKTLNSNPVRPTRIN